MPETLEPASPAMMVFKRPCPVCGAVKGARLGRLAFRAFDDSPLNGVFDLTLCPDCGLVFYDAPLKPEAVESYYRTERRYFTGSVPGGGGESPADRRHQAEIVAYLETQSGSLTAGPVFDVGCGRGGLLTALRAAGLTELYGADFLPEMTADIQKRLGFPAAAAPAGRLPFPEVSPGLIIYSHVLEHAPEPRAVLSEAGRRLAPGGRIFIEVPDASAYLLDIPYRELYLEHINHFDRGALRRLLAETGFQALAISPAIFHLPGGRELPVLRALAERADAGEAPTASPPPSGETPETTAAAHLPRYLAWSAGSPAIRKLAELAAEKRPLWLWGLSQQTMLLLGSPPLAEAEMAGLIDSDASKIGRAIGGRIIAGPRALAGRKEALLLAAWGQEESQRRTLAGLGFQGSIFALSELA